jgi:5-methylcytosine-specific restriction endonuclease McrA
MPAQVEWFTAADVINRWGPGCVACDGPFEHLDHLVPIARRGAHTLANVRPMCAPHNLAKGASDEFQV